MGIRVKVGFKDGVGLQIGQNFPWGTFGVHGESGALGAHGRLRATPLATNCWPKAPRGGGGGRGSWRPRTRGVAPPRAAPLARLQRLSPSEPSSHQLTGLRSTLGTTVNNVHGHPSRHRGTRRQGTVGQVHRGPRGGSLVWAVPYLSNGMMRRVRRWASVLQKPDTLSPSDGIPMGFQAGLPAKQLRVPRVSVRVRARGPSLAGVVEGSLGSLPPRGVLREIPSACDPVLRSVQESLQVLAPSDEDPQPLRGCDLLYVRSEPVPRLHGFLRALFSFLPWLHRALSCGVLLLMPRLHLFVLRMFEDFRLKSAQEIIFDVLKDLTADSWEALLHLSTSPVPQVGMVEP